MVLPKCETFGMSYYNSDAAKHIDSLVNGFIEAHPGYRIVSVSTSVQPSQTNAMVGYVLVTIVYVPAEEVEG